MKTKLFALVSTLIMNIGATFASAISITDNSLTDWDNLPTKYVYESVCPINASLMGIKSVKVYVDYTYINILLEPNMNYLQDLEWVPFHVFIDTDNSNATGGGGDLFTDANADIMLEGALFSSGNPYNYQPAVFRWWGEVGGSEWAWPDPSDNQNCWGAIVCEGQLQGCNSQYVNGKFEIQINRSFIPATWNHAEFGIGFDIEQSWLPVGVLPINSPTANNTNGYADKMKVRMYIDEDIDHEVVVDDVKYFLESTTRTAMVIGVTSSNLHYVQLPSSIVDYDREYQVVSIGSLAFAGCNQLSYVRIPQSLTYLASDAFSGCSSLNSIRWEAKNCRIGHGYSIFPSSTVYTFSFGDEVEVIPAFLCRGLQNVTHINIPESVHSIGEEAFYASGLTSVTIPSGVRNIGLGAFIANITSIDVEENNINYSSQNGVLFDKDKSLLVQYPTGKDASYYTIPNGVKTIASRAFESSKLISVTIPTSVANIGERALMYSHNLKSLTIPKSVKSIENETCAFCENLTSVTIPGSVKSIEEDAFEHCERLASVIMDKGIERIGAFAFSNCGLINLVIPNSVRSIGVGAFKSCEELTTVTLGCKVDSIYGGAFGYCGKLSSVTIYAETPPVMGPFYDDRWQNSQKHQNIRQTPFKTRKEYESENVFAEIDCANVTLYVPSASVNLYQIAEQWNAFYPILPIGAKNTDALDVNVTPAENTAEVVWPQVDGAETYELVIKDKSGNVICTLIFNANGQLTQIAFNAPSRNNAPQQTQAAGFSFTVTGLESGTSYDLTMTSKDSSGGTLDIKTISFSTTGETQGIDTPDSSDKSGSSFRKILRDGQIFILRGAKTYTLTGAEVQ